MLLGWTWVPHKSAAFIFSFFNLFPLTNYILELFLLLKIIQNDFCMNWFDFCIFSERWIILTINHDLKQFCWRMYFGCQWAQWKNIYLQMLMFSSINYYNFDTFFQHYIVMMIMVIGNNEIKIPFALMFWVTDLCVLSATLNFFQNLIRYVISYIKKYYFQFFLPGSHFCK